MTETDVADVASATEIVAGTPAQTAKARGHRGMVAALRTAMPQIGGTVKSPSHPIVLVALVVLASAPCDAFANRAENCSAALMDLSGATNLDLWSIDAALSLLRDLREGRPLDRQCALAESLWEDKTGPWQRWRAKGQVDRARRILTERLPAWFATGH